MDDATRGERRGSAVGQDPSPLLRVIGLKKSYVTPQGRVAVLKGVDLTLDAGASVALMGESGSGKSTLERFRQISNREGFQYCNPIPR
jgi:putative ABC transport system ATP-binding protein